MRHSPADHSSSAMMHFKKRWLQQERSMASSDTSTDMGETSYREEAPTPSSACNLPSRSFCEASLDHVTPTPGYRHHEAAAAAAAAAALNIPRFGKYCARPTLQMHLSSDSSALTDNFQSATSDQPWIIASPAPRGSLKLQLGSRRAARYGKDISHEPTERVMIDINKPPPSPTHSMEYEVSPTPGCESPSPSKTFHMPAVLDYSLTPSPSHSSWLSSGHSDDSGSIICHPRGLPSGLLHLPFLSHQIAPPHSRQTAPGTPALRRMDHSCLPPSRRESSSAGVPAAPQKPSSPQQQQLRRPRSHWATAGDLAVHQRCGGRLGQQGSCVVQEEESHDDGDAEDDDVEHHACGKNDSIGDEQLCRGGVVKSCLHCGTTKTPLWRNGPPGPKSVCNACGIRFNKIKSGKRKPTPKEAAMLLKYERSGSITSTRIDVTPGTPDVTLGTPEKQSEKTACASVYHSEKTAGQQKVYLEDVPSTPVASAHKSRSRLVACRQGSSTVALDAKKPGSKSLLLPFSLGKTEKRSLKRDSSEEDRIHADEEEADDELDGQPLRMAYQPRASKRSCMGAPRGAELAHSQWDAPAVRGDAEADCSTVLEEEHDDVSSSEHESCLSEHGTSSPVSPGAWESMEEGMEEGEYRPALLRQSGNVTAELAAEDSCLRSSGEGCWSEDGQGSEDAELAVAREDADDVETGARLLMEIFQGAPALVHC